MRRTALIAALILSILYLSGCLVISTEGHRHHKHDDATCNTDE